ncbi:MAG: thioredoxin domain-containing protein [Acidobacteriaceae bacterium]
MKKTIVFLAAAAMAFTGAAVAQTGSANSPQSAAQPSAPTAPLQLNSIAAPPKLQFPPANPKDFTAQSPTTQVVNAFLKQLWGYDPNRVWEVVGIQSTDAPSVSKVTILVGEQGVSRSPATTVFFVTPDGNHAIAGASVISFGAHPFADIRQKLEQQATGPHRGSISKNFMLVEFADLQCPHCKEAAATMDKLAQDYPNARIVFQNFPLTNVHPAAEQAAEYGVCVARQKGNAAFFQYAQAVYDTQSDLMSNAVQTLNNAATKAGADAATVSACAATPSTKAAVTASMKLGVEIGVDQTPLLYVNGRAIPVAGVPYPTLKQIISYAAAESAPATAAKQ